MLAPGLILITAEVTTGGARSRLALYSDHAIVLLWLGLEDEVYWFVLTVEEMRRRLDEMPIDKLLIQAFNFEGLVPLPTRQLEGLDEDEDFSGVVLDGDQLVGLRLAPRQIHAVREEDAADVLHRRVIDGEELAVGQDAARVRRKAVQREPVLRGEFDLPHREGTDEGAEDKPFAVVPVFYGTDREIRDDAGLEPSEIYGAGRGDLTYGVAEVSIPRTHEAGEMERPKWWKLEFREDPSRHVVLLGVERLDEAGFVGRVSGGLEAADRPEALVFVHGFNVTFGQAARRAAQLAYDLRYPGLPLLYSWPSQGQTHDYLTDHTNARWTVEHFQRFLTLALSRVGAERVHVLAHSMGNLPLVETLARFDTGALPDGSASLSQVVFAAPDFDADTFRDLARVFPGKAGRFTLYASSHDRALQLSRKLRSDLVRAGESGPHLVVTDGVDTVDASEAESDFFLGHSYYGKRTILSDVFYLLRTGNPPGERFGLRPRRLGQAPYWEFVP